MHDATRVLVVDDDRLVRMDLTFTLKQAGLEVDSCADAADAKRRLAERRYALVLTDVGLPDGNGLEVLREARRRNAAVKVLLLTGSQTAVTAETAAREGAEALILKPFTLAELLARVHAALGPLGCARLVPQPAPPRRSGL